MKAAVYYETGAPDVLRYEDVPDPVPGPGDVLIEVEAISIEGGDTLNRAGGEMPATPHVVGYQCAGHDRRGRLTGVTDRRSGQRVVATMLWGSHAELAVTPALVTWLVPDGADIVEGACVPVAFGTADDCLFEFGRLQAGETVLDPGGGRRRRRRARSSWPSGPAPRCWRTASSHERLDAVRAARPRPRHRLHRSRAGSSGCASSPAAAASTSSSTRSAGEMLQGSLACLAYRGRCITVGSAGRDPQAPRRLVARRWATSRSPACSSAPRSPPTARPAMIAGLVDDVAAGRLDVVVDRTFPLAEAAAAHAFIESRQAVGRVVLTP